MKAFLTAALLSLALAFLPAGAFAQVTEAVAIGEGSGMSRDEAIQSALVNAASQAFGIDLRSSSQTSSLAADASVDGEDHSTLLTALNKNIVQVLRAPTNAPILGYTVDQTSQLPQAGWEASVSLRYAKFERIGADSQRRSVVVVSSNRKYRQMLIQTVGESLVASRRFDVLNRENDAFFQEEKAFILGDDASTAELARLSQASGADYLVISELTSLGISNNQRETIRMTGEVLVKSSVGGALRIQVIEFASRKLKWSGTQKFGGTYPGASSIGSATLSKLINGAADVLIDKMVASIYPIRVVKAMGDTAIINRGEGSVSVGEAYAVFLEGEELTDPQSGESLGSMETEVGLGQITEVRPKFAFIKMSTGTLAADAAYIVRKTSKKIPVAAGTKKPAPRAASPRKPQEPSRKDTFLSQ